MGLGWGNYRYIIISYHGNTIPLHDIGRIQILLSSVITGREQPQTGMFLVFRHHCCNTPIDA